MTPNEPIYAICCRPEVAGDVVSGERVKTIEGLALLNFEAACISRITVSKTVNVFRIS